MNAKSEWIEVGELGEGFAPNSNILEPSGDLAGKAITLYFNNGWVIEYHLESLNELSWKTIEGPEKGLESRTKYHATSLRDGIYFVDFINGRERAMCVSLVLDLNQGIFTAVIGELPTQQETRRDLYSRVQAADELTGVKATFHHGSIDNSHSDDTPCHGTSADLVGKRVQYTYSDTEAYEHIYLNEKLYTWQCLKGLEKGLGDSDRCHYYKIAENLYLFVWREKIIPTLGIVMVDLDRLKTTGKIFGYADSNFKKLANFPVGAFAQVLNHTQYELG